MTKQEIKLQIENIRDKYNDISIKTENSFNNIKTQTILVIKNMYGVEGLDVKFEDSSWREISYITFEDKETQQEKFTVKVKNNGELLFNISSTITQNESDDYINLYASLLFDYKNKKGLFSVVGQLVYEYKQNLESRKELSRELSKKEMEYNVINDVEKESIFYGIVKENHVIKKNDNNYWVITKITNKFVFVIQNQENKFSSVRYTKDGFFNQVKNHVNFSEE